VLRKQDIHSVLGTLKRHKVSPSVWPLTTVSIVAGSTSSGSRVASPPSGSCQQGLKQSVPYRRLQERETAAMYTSPMSRTLAELDTRGFAKLTSTSYILHLMGTCRTFESRRSSIRVSTPEDFSNLNMGDTHVSLGVRGTKGESRESILSLRRGSHQGFIHIHALECGEYAGAPSPWRRTNLALAFPS
jgi:hypothetical protein